jgi:putative type III restriction-modification system, mod subunit
MDKMKMHTPNKADEKFEKLAAMFPNAVTETIDVNGVVVRAIDKDVLMQEISCKVVEGREERYQFTWPDKKKSVLTANAPINKTLRPVREDETVPTGSDSEGNPYCSTGSVNFDTTENLYIEGDNLEVLKLLQETYLGKIKMIYIDPPYNTGNDFVYEDDFVQTTDAYILKSGQLDEDGNRLVTNTESNGRFHTDWLNMIYPRLRLAKDLLSDDGAIFISIDDNELENIKKCCEEIFGESNFIANIVWKHTQQSKNDELYFSRQYNHTLCYAKNKDNLKRFYFERTEEDNKNYSNPDGDPKGMWRSGDVRSPNYRKTLCFNIVAPNGNIIEPPANGWRWSEESVKEKIASGEIKFKDDFSGIIRKIYLYNQPGRTPENLWEGNKFGTTRQAAALIKELFDGIQVFDTPKPIELIKAMVSLVVNKNDIVLDFFSGSASTAHSVIKLNEEDGGSRKFIMVQLPEITDDKSEAAKAGYRTICEIGKERIRHAAKKIAEENPNAKFDGGFRVLKCDSSNMKDVYYNPEQYEANLFTSLTDNIKEDRTPEDLLFQVMLDLGVELSSKIAEYDVAGKKVFNVADGFLIACFDDDVTEETIKAVAKLKPYYFVMRDSSMADDSVATNFEQLFATYSPETVRKVL